MVRIIFISFGAVVGGFSGLATVWVLDKLLMCIYGVANDGAIAHNIGMVIVLSVLLMFVGGILGSSLHRKYLLKA